MKTEKGNLKIEKLGIECRLESKAKHCSFLFSAITACSWICSSRLLTRLSGSCDSWPRNNSRIIPFPQQIRMKTGNKIGYNSRRHWRRTKLGLEGPHVWSGTHSCYAKVTRILNQANHGSENMTAVWTAHARDRAWPLMFPVSSLVPCVAQY